MATGQTPSKTASPARLRLGLLFFVLWWIPVYLTVPALTAALGDQGNRHATEIIAGSIVVLQTIIGLLGVWLLGKQLALTLKRVSYRRLPKVIWRAVWSGRTAIDAADLKPVKSRTRS